MTFWSFYILELNLIVWISNALKAELARTGALLHSTSVRADVRLKQSVSAPDFVSIYKSNYRFNQSKNVSTLFL